MRFRGGYRIGIILRRRFRAKCWSLGLKIQEENLD